MAQVQVQHQTPTAVSAPLNGVVATPNSNFITTSLYVGDLDLNVNDSQLYDLFNQVGLVVSVRVCKDLASRRSLGYGYLNFSNPQDAARALYMLNFTPLNSKSIRVMYSHRDPSIRKNGTANTFIENLDKTIDHKALHDTFSTFGHILSCKIATDGSGQSNGFVQFDIEESAQNAIDKLNDSDSGNSGCPDSGNSGPTDCGVLGKWTVGSDFWWRKLSSLCRGSCCSPYEWALS